MRGWQQQEAYDRAVQWPLAAAEAPNRGRANHDSSVGVVGSVSEYPRHNRGFRVGSLRRRRRWWRASLAGFAGGRRWRASLAEPHKNTGKSNYAQWWRNAKICGLFTTPCTITRGDLPLQKTIFCLETFLSRLLMHGSAVRGLRLIATSRRGARDLSCSHGGDCAGCPKGPCIGKRGEGRWWVRSPANSRTIFFKGTKGLSNGWLRVSVTVPPGSAVPRPLHPKPGASHCRSQS